MNVQPNYYHTPNKVDAKMRRERARGQSAHSLKLTKEMVERRENPVDPIEVLVNLQATIILLRRRH